MKKSLILIFITSIILIFNTGCSNKQEQLNDEEINVYVDPEFEGAPKWINSPKLEGKIVEIGSAPKNVGNDFAFQREEAVANARNNLARRISVKVDNMFKTYKSTTGITENGTFDKVIESVSKQISSEILKNSVIENMWVSKSKTMYVLVSLDGNEFKSKVKNISKSSFKNEDALYQKYLADDADKKLDEMIETLNDE